LTFQEDIVTDDVFILDAYDNIFLWIGEDARPEEKTMAMDAAIVSDFTSVSLPAAIPPEILFLRFYQIQS